jgi:hypothetical protein
VLQSQGGAGPPCPAREYSRRRIVQQNLNDIKYYDRSSILGQIGVRERQPRAFARVYARAIHGKGSRRHSRKSNGTQVRGRRYWRRTRCCQPSHCVRRPSNAPGRRRAEESSPGRADPRCSKQHADRAHAPPASRSTAPMPTRGCGALQRARVGRRNPRTCSCSVSTSEMRVSAFSLTSTPSRFSPARLTHLMSISSS